MGAGVEDAWQGRQMVVGSMDQCGQARRVERASGKPR